MRKLKCGLFTLSISFLLVGVSNMRAYPVDKVAIIREGNPLAAIVIPDGAGDTEQFAASELQKYLERISGALLPVGAESAHGGRPFISVGRTRLSSGARKRLSGKPVDSFAVEVADKGIVLVGEGERGTLFAVYDFLERELGCRWLGPRDIWEEIPSRTTIEVPAGSRIEEPALLYRIGNRHAPGWSLKHKMNVPARASWDGPPVRASGWRNWHSSPALALEAGENPQGVFIYPEWTALGASGLRSGVLDPNNGTCFSNLELRDLFAERLSQLLRERPELDFVELGAADMLPRCYCRCDACLALLEDAAERGRSGTHTHAWLRLANAVAERLAESDPERKLLISAYSVYQAPPDPEVIVPADNVMVKIATWSGCRLHGYDHGLNDDTVPVQRAERHAVHRGWKEAWREITPAGVLVAEYLSRNAMDGLAGINPRRYIEDMRFLHRRGFVGYWPVVSRPQAFQLINVYAANRAMWNPDADPDELVRDFCDHAFHEASRPMQRFIHTVQDAMVTAYCDAQGVHSWMEPDVMAEARRHLDAAHAAAAGNETVKNRLLEFELLFGYAEFAGPAWIYCYRFLRERREKGSDPELMREAIRLGEKAQAYRDEVQKEYRREYWLFHAGWRLRRNLGEGGNFHRWLALGEREALRAAAAEAAADEDAD